MIGSGSGSRLRPPGLCRLVVGGRPLLQPDAAVADSGFWRVGRPLRRRGAERSGLRYRAHLAAGFGSQQVPVRPGAAALAAHLPDAVLPVGGAPAGLHAAAPPADLQVVVRLVLRHVSQPAHRLGAFPCRRAGAAQRVGAGDGNAAHLRDHMTDVVAMADEAAANDRLLADKRDNKLISGSGGHTSGKLLTC